MKAIVLLLLTSLLCEYPGMQVLKWGTDSYSARLAWATKSFFKEAVTLMTLGQNGVYHIGNLTKNFELSSPKNMQWDTRSAKFVAYNGWLNGLKLETDRADDVGYLRRIIMTSAEKDVHEKDSLHSAFKHGGEHHHEIIICDYCLALSANGFKYGYHSILERPTTHSWGIISQDKKIFFPLSFRLTVMTGQNLTSGRHQCFATLDEIKLDRSETDWLDWSTVSVKHLTLQSFPFLADFAKEWFHRHFNITVLEDLQLKVNAYSKLLLESKDICTEFLTSGNFIAIDNKY